MEEKQPELITDRPPTQEDLVGLCSQMYADDPRSVFYQRALERPKINVWRVLAHLFLIMVVMTGAGFLTWYFLETLWLAICLPWCLVIVYALIRAKALLLFLVRLYQRIAPTWLRKRCRFEPSCSQYMIAAIEKYGVWKGFKKGFRRWCHCKPPNGGYDYP